MVSVKDKMGSGSNGSLAQPAKCSEGQVGEKNNPFFSLVSKDTGQQE